MIINMYAKNVAMQKNPPPKTQHYINVNNICLFDGDVFSVWF